MSESKSMYIGKLFFEDYHSFQGSNVLDLLDKDGHLYQWTVFLGNNNTGKTNFLKAIADLETVFVEHQNPSNPSDKFYSPIFSEKKRQLNEYGNLQVMVGADIYETKESTKDKNISKLDLKKLTYKYQIENGGPFWWYKPNQWRIEANNGLENLKIYGYGVTRRIGNKGLSDKKEELNAASLFDTEHKLTNIEEWLFQLDYASKNERPEAGDRLQLLKEIIKSDILPEILDFRFITSDDLRNYIEYQTKEGWFLFNQLGYGYQATMSWVIDLCKKMFERYPKSDNPLSEPAIVLVDELDLHLHPKWQKTIVTYLTKTFTATQFIITTHSPLILQTLEKVNLFALVKTEKNVIIRRIPTQSLEGWSVEEILKEVMDMDDAIYSEKHNALYQQFDEALDADNYSKAKLIYDELIEILHPTNPERKILKLQLSQITPLNDKA